MQELYSYGTGRELPTRRLKSELLSLCKCNYKVNFFTVCSSRSRHHACRFDSKSMKKSNGSLCPGFFMSP